MASDSYPRPGFNSGAVTELLYERLAAPQSPDGLIGHPADSPLVYADGLGTRLVRLRANRQALVRGFQYDSGPTDIDLQLPTNTSGTTRTDLIVLRLTRATWRVQETFIQGTPGQGAPAPLATEAVFDLPVASVAVDHNAAGIAPNKVTNLAWYVGSDGQILCTSKTRPPHQGGRRIFETDVARALLSVGTSWLVTAGEATGSIATFGGFSHSGQVLRRRGGMVTFALTAWKPSAGLAANTVYRCANVPDGFQPLDHMSTVGIVPSTGSVFTCSVGIDGAVLLNPGTQSIPAGRACVLSAMTYPVA